MTIVGKILVILVFLASIALGAFQIIDYSTRTNWKAAYESLEREMKVSQVNRTTSSTTFDKVEREARKYRAETEELKLKLIDQEKASKALEESLRFMIEDALNKAKDADLNVLKAQAEQERLKTEIKDIGETIKKRESLILSLEKDIQKYRNEAVAADNVAKTTTERNISLLAQVQQLTATIARMQAGVAEGPTSKDPNAPNPPSSYVKGTIMKVHPDDKGLVEISLGSDHGVNKNNTLEVYRLQPKAEYLGTIRIVDARAHNSVGRLMRQAGTTVRSLQEGDIVASSISANK